jgi:integrase
MWSDIDLERGTISVRQQLQPDQNGKLTFRNLKTERSRRVIHLPIVTARALQGHRARQREESVHAWQWEDNDLVFCTEGARLGNVGGRPLRHRNVFRLLQMELSRADLPHQRLYDLRHLAASLLLAQGASMREVMEVLGHSQMSLTSDTYSHLYDEARKASADRMDKALMNA